jgi:hypothetical protein
MKLMLRAVNMMKHAQTSTKKQCKEAHGCVHYLLVHIQVAAAESEVKGAWYSCRQGYLLEAVVLLVWRNMHSTARCW